jgi:hypothetical protein
LFKKFRQYYLPSYPPACCHLFLDRIQGQREAYVREFSDDDIDLCAFDDCGEDMPVPRCDMHIANLALGLALGLVERRVNKRVVNRWDPFLSLYKSVKDATKFIFDKKNKRFADYERVLSEIQMRSVSIGLPSDTRVAGAMVLFQEFLRAVNGMRYYATQCPNFKTKMLSQTQLRQVAQFEAVMRPLTNACFDFQSDRVEVAGEMVLSVVLMKCDYEDDKVYRVVDTQDTEYEADTPFQQLPFKKMTTSSLIAVEEQMQ